MSQKSNKHIGSDFDQFLAEEGLLANAAAVATKRVIVYKLEQARKAKHMSKTLLANRMRTTRAQVDRVLDPNNTSVTLKTLGKAAEAVGKKLRFSLA